MFKLHTCIIVLSINSIKRLLKFRKRLVLQGLGGGELFPSVCPGVGNRPPEKKKIANPRGGGGGGAW